MTRAEKAKRRDEIKERYRNGATADELAEEYGLTKGYIWQIVDIKRTHKISTVREGASEIILRLRNGETQTEIARSYGVDRGAVYTVLKENGFNFKPQKNSEEEVGRKIKEKTGGLLEYLSGYTKKENPVLVRCNVCDEEYEVTFHHITTRFTGCLKCRELNSQEEKSRERLEKQATAFRKKLKTAARKADNAKQFQIVFCETCGKALSTVDGRRKYCSDACQRAGSSYNNSSDDRLNKANIVDRGITLQKLFDRDKGVCQICGEACDYSDYLIRDNGVFIAGGLYPSKDHILPLSKGGKHSWRNVRLAHRACNTNLYWKRQRFTPSRAAE